MLQTRLPIRLMLHPVILLLAVLLLDSPGLAMTGAPDASSLSARNFGGTSPLIIPSAAFAPDGRNADAIQFNTNGFLYGASIAGDACVQAPAYLPQGARVTALRMLARDKTTEEQIEAALDRYRNDGTEPPQPLGQTTSLNSVDDTPDWTSDGTIINSEIDYAQYSYYVRVCFFDNDPDLRLYQVNIEYTEQLIFADDFERGDTTRWSSSAPASSIAPVTRQEYGNPLFLPAAQFNYTGTPGGVKFALDDGYFTGDLNYLSRFFQAPIYLPDGAQVASTHILAYDNDNDNDTLCPAGQASNVEFWVYRFNNVTGLNDGVAVAHDVTSGAVDDWASLYDLADWTFTQSTHTYYLVVRLCGNAQRIYGAQFFYTMP